MSMKCVARLFFSALYVVSVAGCVASVGTLSRSECYDYEMVRSFFEKTQKERLAIFRGVDLEVQYLLLRCGNQVIHPPMMSLADEFARNGSIGVEFLKKRLLERNDDLTVRDIIRVFVEMTKQKTYDVKGDVELVDIIVSAINRMRDSGWRQICNYMLTENGILNP